MNTLRAKIATLIVVAIVTVIGLVSWLTILTVPIPAYERLVDLASYYVSIVVKSGGSYQEIADAPFIGKTGSFGIQSEAASGEVVEDITQYLRSALQQRNISTAVIVTQTTDNFWPVASIAIPGKGWLVIPVNLPRPPTEILLFLFGWIAAGTAVVAIAVVCRLMRPLALIEKSVAHINPSGELPALTENGPADIRATARAINLLSSRLKGAMESRMRLVAAAGHDFRTPMTRMRLRAEFLGDTDREKWLADIDELDHIADSAIRLVHEETEISNAATVRLDCLVSDVVAELRELQLDVSAMGTEPVRAVAKPLSLKRAMRNLLINAATHGGGATVGIRRKYQSVLVEIVDNGPGIPDELLARAFEPFFRVGAARSSMGGAGLGLAIAREIIQRHRGSLILANRPGGGLIQTIEIPAASNAENYSIAARERSDRDADGNSHHPGEGLRRLR